MKLEDYLEQTKINRPELKDSLNELHISNDVSYNGYDEFKFGDVRISLSREEPIDASGTGINIEFPLGIGLYVSYECYRDSSNPGCAKIFESSKTEKHISCGQSIIPSSYVIGTGFLISKDGIDKTRRKSLINRVCNRPIKYGGYLIPDGLTISEIYDSEAHSSFFTDSQRFVSYLSSGFGISLTSEELDTIYSSFTGGLPILGSFSSSQDSLKKKKNSKNSSSIKSTEKENEKQMLMSLFEINVIRYALFIEDVRPQNLDPFFIVDFMSLPEDYYQEDAADKYEKFIFRYGTHYIHSAEFGGQIMLENTRVAGKDADLNDLAEKSWQEIQSAFGSGTNIDAKLSIPVKAASANLGFNFDRMDTHNLAEKLNQNRLSKSSQAQQRNWTNVFVQSQGGNINIAQLVTRLESNTGSVLLDWLRSIPQYPKAFKLKMRPINELLNINIRGIFIQELDNNATCHRTSSRLCAHGTTIEEFQREFDKRRQSLGFAIDVFRHKNSYQFTDLEIEPGTPDTCLFSIHSNSNLFPTYEEILNGTDAKIVMELDDDYSPFFRGEEIFLMYYNDLWFSRTRNENFNFLRTYKMPNQTNSSIKKPIVIRNLVFDYDELSGELIYKEIGNNLESHPSLLNAQQKKSRGLKPEYWDTNIGILSNQRIAQMSYVNALQGIGRARNDRFFIMPCNLDWSSGNARRFSISAQHAKCLRFIASSSGDIFVVFATNPNDEYSWYMVQISSYGVGIYRAGFIVKYKLEPGAGSLKDPNLFRRFFICMNIESETTGGVLIQYGIVQGYDSEQVVKMSYLDLKPLEPRYYIFGRYSKSVFKLKFSRKAKIHNHSYDAKVYIYDITVNKMTLDDEAQIRCSKTDLETSDLYRCQNICHKNCLGCYKANSSISCTKCRFGSTNDEFGRIICIDSCPVGFIKDHHLQKCIDIDECNSIQTRIRFMKDDQPQYKGDIYEWSQCDYELSKCINTLGSYECRCREGYERDGARCVDIDECSRINTQHDRIEFGCPWDSICHNYPGGYTCECEVGYRNVSNRCEDINECWEYEEICGINSECKNTLGSFRCVCKRGFIGNGVFCQDQDECSDNTNDCGPNSFCINTIGSYLCE